MKPSRSLLTLGLILFGCGAQVSTTSSGEGEGAETGTDAGPMDGGEDADADPDVPSPCSDEELFCDGECIDPSANNDHCGRCGNQCDNLSTIGPCDNGSCPPNYECGGDRTDYRDCNEVCEALGSSCSDGVGCSGSHSYFYGIQGLEFCQEGLGGSNSEHGDCSTPIDWERKGGLLLDDPVAVACCCLQE